MLLEIIVPHYNEPWSVVRPFFEMLRCQRCADFDSFTVHIVHDGTEAFPESVFSEMPFKVRQSVIKHGGVSAARNYGMDHSGAEWICFCDCDDTFVSIYALHEVMNVLPADGYDLLWCRMIAEDYVGEEKRLYFSPDRARFVFTHGKFYRRQYLIDEGIRFDEKLVFNEDSCFNATIIARLPYKRIGEIRSTFPIYAWIRRANSVTNSGREDEAEWGHFNRNLIVTEENRKHRDEASFRGMVTRTAYDTFYMIHGRRISDGMKAKIMALFAPWIAERIDVFGKCNADDLERIRDIARIELTDIGDNYPDDHKCIAEWVYAIADADKEQGKVG